MSYIILHVFLKVCLDLMDIQPKWRNGPAFPAWPVWAVDRFRLESMESRNPTTNWTSNIHSRWVTWTFPANKVFFCTRNTFNCRKVQIKFDFYVYFGNKTGINSDYEIKLVNMSQALHELKNKSVIYSTRMNLLKAESFCVWILLYLLLFCHLLVLLWW